MIEGLKDEWMKQEKGKNPEAITDWIKRKTENIAYGDDPLQKIDIYLPETGKGPFPVIIMVHGGGLCLCDKHDFHLYPMFYALSRGYAVAAVNYRLSPAVKYPQHVYDTNEAVLYIYRHADEYDIDKNNMFLWGASAGGNLVLMSGLKKGMDMPEEIKTEKLPIRGIAALCAEATMTERGGIGHKIGTFLEKIVISLSFMNLHKNVLGTNKPSEDVLAKASVFTYLGGGIAPLYIQHGDKDPAIPFSQSVKLYEEGRKVLGENDIKLDIIEGGGHMGGCVHYFEEKHVTPVLDFFDGHIVKEKKNNDK